jgi:RNA polymerase sigma factor (TIGR02999 family)
MAYLKEEKRTDFAKHVRLPHHRRNRETGSIALTSDITVRLAAWRGGDLASLEPVMPELYDLLRQIAVQRLRGESDSVTLDPTDLVHEAMSRMLGAGKAFADRAHFLAVSALYMRSILVDRARAVLAGRRPGAQATITLGSAVDVPDDLGAMDVVVLDEALRKLETLEPRAAAAMELAAFSGMQREEIAQTLAVSVPTVDRDLRFARAFVNRALA